MIISAQDENQELRRQQISLAKFGELALRSDDLSEILTEACRLVRDALGTELAKVVQLQENGTTLLVVAGIGWKPGVIGVATVDFDEDTSESVALKMGKPMASADIDQEVRFHYAPFLIDNDVKAIVNVVILGGKGRPPFGILQVDSKVPREFTSSDVNFLRGYANLIAAAVERLRADKELRAKEAILQQSQKMEAIGRLAAGVAHDFNNILQSVSGGLELVLEDVEPGTPMQEFAEIALTAAQRGSYLTGHLLSYARKQMLQPKSIDLGSFLAGLHSLLAPTLGPHITISVVAEPGLYNIHVDPGQLQTALLNLAINAAQAMPQSGKLSLEARASADASRPFVVISVNDTGIGIDEITLAQVFEPFFTTKGLGGSGLGLSMVQGFAEQSGGSVSIKSAPGKGTTVELKLPALDPTRSPNQPWAEIPQMQGAGSILLVDDVAEVLATTAAFLNRAGFRVTRSATTDYALAALAGERFDALVTDYAMPNMNGLELITKARSLQPDLPALIISGFAVIGWTESLPASVAVLHKPFKREQLVKALTECLRSKPG